ncbi:MAG TPA: glycoside hydrolase family 99-like domain-containing protein, partial [Acidimicrobiales bacterium]|nr:glycoside hydrolase family 99-like domain-containing protein [Acidimicrobiales bacterium]
MGHVPSPPVTSDAPDVAVTVVLHLRNGLDHVGECIMALVDHTNDVAFQTLIVDHATTDATAGIIASLSGDLAVIRANPVEGYAPPTDRAVTMARAPVLVFLDPDTVVGPGWLGPLLARLGADASLAALQPRVVTADARVWSTGGVRAADGRPLLRDHGRPAGTPGADRVDETIDFLDGSCLVVRRSAFLAAGGYDPAYPPGICQHADLSLALTGLGHRIDYEPTVTVTALARPDLRSGRRRLAAKWPVTPPARRVRSVAFYLPQFHPIAENDLWWGRGFTEWTNVTRVGPRFEGHDQPHLPADLGFCDLRLPETRAAQADLARRHGVDAFCYYHYWFEGRRLLQRPFEEVLASGEPDFPFCLCWANEDWRRNWDGRSGETLVAQHYSEADDRAHIAWLLPVFADPRYLRVDGKPLFLVYRASQLPDPPRTLALWREAARAGGLGELLLCRVESFSADHADPRPLGFDASVEFQPDWDVLETRPRRMDSPGLHYDYDDVVSAMEVKPRPSWRRIP